MLRSGAAYGGQMVVRAHNIGNYGHKFLARLYRGCRYIKGKPWSARRLAAVQNFNLLWVFGIVLALGQQVASPARAQEVPLLFKGSTVVTGFSNTEQLIETENLPSGMSPSDVTFIDPMGISARFYLPDQPGYFWDARLWDLDAYHEVQARDIGQVFGIAIDDGWPRNADGTAEPANVYLGATSTFGLNIVLPDRNSDGLADRVIFGQPEARFMDWQFGGLAGSGAASGLLGGPGTIYKVDGRTRQVSLFANITLGGRENSGPGLGNIAFDNRHDQLFVSDRDTGMIHRLDLDGFDLEQFDHGVTARVSAGLPPVPFDPDNRLDVTDSRFDSEDPDTWAYARAERRVWGMAVHGGRLFYAVAQGPGPQVWSVGIDDATGSILGDARWELDVNPEGPDYEVSDIVFNAQGAMILAQRGEQDARYDYSSFMKPRRARVYRYWPETPDDPLTDGRWHLDPEEYAVGFRPDHRNSAGGVDLNYGYTDQGVLDTGDCEGSIWFTGESLRLNPELNAYLIENGELVVHGIQGSPSDLVREFNVPPWFSYFVDYDKKYDDPRVAGHMGDVEVYRPCGRKITVFHLTYQSAQHDSIFSRVHLQPLSDFHQKCRSYRHDVKTTRAHERRLSAFHRKFRSFSHDVYETIFHDRLLSDFHQTRDSGLHDARSTRAHDRRLSAFHQTYRSYLHDAETTGLYEHDNRLSEFHQTRRSDRHEAQTTRYHDRRMSGLHITYRSDLHDAQTTRVHDRRMSEYHQEFTSDTHDAHTSHRHDRRLSEFHCLQRSEQHDAKTTSAHDRKLSEFHQTHKSDRHDGRTTRAHDRSLSDFHARYRSDRHEAGTTRYHGRQLSDFHARYRSDRHDGHSTGVHDRQLSGFHLQFDSTLHDGHYSREHDRRLSDFHSTRRSYRHDPVTSFEYQHDTLLSEFHQRQRSDRHDAQTTRAHARPLSEFHAEYRSDQHETGTTRVHNRRLSEFHQTYASDRHDAQTTRIHDLALSRFHRTQKSSVHDGQRTEVHARLLSQFHLQRKSAVHDGQRTEFHQQALSRFHRTQKSSVHDGQRTEFHQRALSKFHRTQKSSVHDGKRTEFHQQALSRFHRTQKSSVHDGKRTEVHARLLSQFHLERKSAVHDGQRTEFHQQALSRFHRTQKSSVHDGKRTEVHKRKLSKFHKKRKSSVHDGTTTAEKVVHNTFKTALEAFHRTMSSNQHDKKTSLGKKRLQPEVDDILRDPNQTN